MCQKQSVFYPAWSANVHPRVPPPSLQCHLPPASAPRGFYGPNSAFSSKAHLDKQAGTHFGLGGLDGHVIASMHSSDQALFSNEVNRHCLFWITGTKNWSMLRMSLPPVWSHQCNLGYLLLSDLQKTWVTSLRVKTFQAQTF